MHNAPRTLPTGAKSPAAHLLCLLTLTVRHQPPFTPAQSPARSQGKFPVIASDDFTLAVRAIIQTQWLAYGRRLVVKEVFLHLLLLGLFAAYCLLLPDVVEAFVQYNQAVLAGETGAHYANAPVVGALVALSIACVLVAR